MRGDFIDLFMWGFQRHFRIGVEIRVASSLSIVGASVEPVVFLVGLLAPGREGHPVCIEPEDGPLSPGDFSGHANRADELFELDPDRHFWISDARSHKLRQQRVRERAFGNAIAEVLEDKLGDGIRFFVANPTLVEQHWVYTAIGIPGDVIDNTPRLSATASPDRRVATTSSLIEGAIDELLRCCTRALRDPDPGTGLNALGIEDADVSRSAARALAGSAVVLSGSLYGASLYDSMNRLATTRYERRIGLGRLVVADPASKYVDRIFTLAKPIPIADTRTLRKMLEVSSERVALLTDGDKVYGLGRIRADYDAASESVFEVGVVGHGSWDLRHAGTTLMTVEHGAPRLPEPRLDGARFEDTMRRVFASSGGCDADAVWGLAKAAAEAEHGTMLVVSAMAAEEAERLGSQALAIEPAALTPEVVHQVTSIDGAVLVDPTGVCHAIGVILDGTATGEGDRSRGARYNSAVRYLGSTSAPTLIVLVSEDGMINLLPDLHPLMHRSDVSSLMAELQVAALTKPPDAERFSHAYNRIKAVAFYLSQEQCAEVNKLRDEHWERRIAAGAQIRVLDTPLVPNPEMSDSYWAD